MKKKKNNIKISIGKFFFCKFLFHLRHAKNRIKFDYFIFCEFLEIKLFELPTSKKK